MNPYHCRVCGTNGTVPVMRSVDALREVVCANCDADYRYLALGHVSNNPSARATLDQVERATQEQL